MSGLQFSPVLLVVVGLAGCASSGEAEGFDSAVPAARMDAMQSVGDSVDPVILTRLVEQLDSEDAAVRLMAIHHLERLTNRTYGYVYSAPVDERRAAIDRWVDAIESGELQGAADSSIHEGDGHG
jgi:hypothetical protein